MVGQLAEGSADVATGAVAETEDRRSVADFSLAFFNDYTTLTVALASGRRAPVDAAVFLLVFRLPPWVALLTALMSVTLVHAAVEASVGDKMPRRESSVELSLAPVGAGGATWVKGLGDGLVKLFLAVIQRGPELPRLSSLSSKVLFLTVHALGFLIFTYYTGDLTATMTSGNRLPGIKSFQVTSHIVLMLEIEES
jgi:hypothetical protein